MHATNAGVAVPINVRWIETLNPQGQVVLAYIPSGTPIPLGWHAVR